MTQTLRKIHKKKVKIPKKFFLSKSDQEGPKIISKQKKNFGILNFFGNFSKCFGHFLWKKNLMSKNDF